jgi:tellurite resistance protein TehA-like permease
VAIIAVILTLSFSLSGLVSSGVLLSIIIYSIGVTIGTSLLSWFVFSFFRNKRIKDIQEKFIEIKKGEPKAT